MKYKNISAAIHNFGDSFLSSMNYVDDDYIIEDLRRIHGNGHDIKIDWLDMTFEPEAEATARIVKSMGHYREGLAEQLQRSNVDLGKLQELNFRWPAGSRKFMETIDDQGKTYKIFVRERK